MRVIDHLAEFAERKEAEEIPAARPVPDRSLPQKRSKSRQRRGSSQRALKRRTYNQDRSPRASKFRRPPKKDVKEEDAPEE